MSLFHDHRASALLSRVRDDVEQLGSNVGDIISRTTRKTIPRGAKAFSESALHHLEEGRDFAADRLRRLRSRPPEITPAIGVLGGALLIGAIAAGVYLYLNGRSSPARTAEQELEDELDGDVIAGGHFVE